MLSAELSIAATEAFGPDNDISLEASVIRSSAHLEMNHPVEAVVHAMPLLLADNDRLAEDLPELSDRFAELTSEIMKIAAKTGDPDATADSWYAEAQRLIAQRDAAGTAELDDYEALGQAIYGGDPTTADAIARKLTATVLADDPFPAAIYDIMILSHLTAGDPASAVPWAKRLADMPAEYLAAQDIDPQEAFTDISLWLAEQGRLSEALEINALSLGLTALREDMFAPALQELRLERSGLLALSRDYTAAMAETERALAENSAFSPAEPVLRAKILSEFGQLAIELKEFARAEAHLSEAVALLQSTGQTEDLNWTDTLTSYASSLSALGRDEEAISILEQSLDVRRQLTGDVSQSDHYRADHFGRCPCENRAEHCRGSDLSGGPLQPFRDNSDAGNPLAVALTLGYADLLDRTGQTDAADQLFAEATLLSQDATDTRQPFGVVTYQQLANRARSQGRLDDASGYLDAALEQLPDSDPAVSEIRTQQGHIALEEGDLELALKMFRGGVAAAGSARTKRCLLFPGLPACLYRNAGPAGPPGRTPIGALSG